uniref:non-specific serine/threonine protein kinase n=1 Tax=Anopheles atroparvus TaxID=41427 RepID=A0A182J333_ANOAO
MNQVGQEQQRCRRPRQSRQDNDEEDNDGHRAAGIVASEGRRVEAATVGAAEADAAGGEGAPPNGAVVKRGRGVEAVQGNQIEAGCVTARAEGNNNNGSGSAAPAATPSAGSVQEQIPAIMDRYVLHGKIDRGTFSTVSLATRRDEQHLPMDKRRMFAIKLITQTSHPTRIEREIRCMQAIGGQSNVVMIVDGFRHQGSVGLVMNYIPHEPFHVYYAQLSPAEVQRYLRQLLVALARVHQYGVIHRDVKPSNFLHSRRNGGTFMLVDFGLAQELRTVEPPTGSFEQPPPVKRHKPLPKEGSGNGAVVATAEQVVFRNPLKQQQQGNKYTISPLKVSNNTLKDLVQSPLARQIKSAAIGIGNGLKSRRSMAGVTGTPPNSARSENTRQKTDLVGVSPLARQVKLAAAGIGAGLKNNRQPSNPAVPSPTPAMAAAAARQSSDLPWCECYGKAQVCNRCLVKRELHAPRAGTPGYRPPEVLLKYPDQTTAVDMWAAGVIFLSLLSKCYPFFGNTDDMTSLAQIISVFGYERINETARSLDRTLLVPEEMMRMKALSLRRICQHYRRLVHRRESTTGSGGTAMAALSGGSSPPPGADDAGDDCCSNCAKPPARCLCQERNEREVKKEEDEEGGGTADDCDKYGSAAYDLLERLLETDPHRRITAADALQHPYFAVQY